MLDAFLTSLTDNYSLIKKDIKSSKKISREIQSRK